MPIAFIAAVPEHNGRVICQAAGLVEDLCGLRGRGSGCMVALRKEEGGGEAWGEEWMGVSRGASESGAPHELRKKTNYKPVRT